MAKKSEKTFKNPKARAARVRESFKKFLVVKIQELTAERDQYEAHSKLLKKMVRAMLQQDRIKMKKILQECVDYLYNGKRVAYRYSPVFKEYCADQWDAMVPENRMEMLHRMGVRFETFRTWYLALRGHSPRVGKKRRVTTTTPVLHQKWEIPDVGEKGPPPEPEAPGPLEDMPRTYLPADLYEEV